MSKMPLAVFLVDQDLRKSRDKKTNELSDLVLSQPLLEWDQELEVS